MAYFGLCNSFDNGCLVFHNFLSCGFIGTPCRNTGKYSQSRATGNTNKVEMLGNANKAEMKGNANKVEMLGNTNKGSIAL